jgi:hypothetical protein
MPFSSTQSVTNLGTTTVNLPNTDIYSLVGTLTLTSNAGSASTGPGGGTGTGAVATPLTVSQVVTTVKQNGTTILTTAAGATGFSIPALVATAGDVITVITTSSLPQDQQPQAIKMTLAVSQGPL